MPILWFSGPGVTAHNGAYVVSRAAIGKNWGCEAETPSRFVFAIETTDEGVVHLTLGNQIGDLRLSLAKISLAPLNGAGNVMREEDLGTPVRRWRCGSPADGTDLNPNYLPGSCRG